MTPALPARNSLAGNAAWSAWPVPAFPVLLPWKPAAKPAGSERLNVYTPARLPSQSLSGFLAAFVGVKLLPVSSEDSGYGGALVA